MLTQEDLDFLAGPFERIEGWCHVEAAAITFHMQRYQLSRGWAAPNYEIGVYAGKYLSVLHHAAAAAGQRTTGIDIFQKYPRAAVQEGLNRELGAQSNLTLIEHNSSLY